MVSPPSGLPHQSSAHGRASLNRVIRGVSKMLAKLGPPVPTRLLQPVREQAFASVLADFSDRAAALRARVRAGELDARDELAALAGEAMVEMRVQVQRAAAARNPWTNAAAIGDAIWGDCDTVEWIDDPTVDEAVRTHIMTWLDQFNHDFRSYDQFFETLRPLLNDNGPTRVLDLAAGHGGFARAAALRARDLGLDIHFTVSDLKAEYLDIGADLARQEGLPVDFVVQDALDLTNLDCGAYDLIICTQSLHHFPPGLITVMFEAATRAAGTGVVFADLSRSALSGALAVALAATKLDRAVAHDSWVSTRKSYVAQELALLARLGCQRGQLESRWMAPAHCLLRWTP